MANIGYDGMANILMNTFRDCNIDSDVLAKWRDEMDSEIKAITDEKLTLMKFIRETESEIRRLESLKNQVESAKASLADSFKKQDTLCARRNLIENMMISMLYMEEDQMKSVHDMTSEEYAEYRNKYIDFMYNPSNEHNCSECPENINGNGCGQHNCWVTVHCERQSDDTE